MRKTTEDTLLHQLAALDPASEKAPTSTVTIEHTRQWVLGQDKLDGTPLADPSPVAGVAGLVTLLEFEREPVTPKVRPAVRRPVRRTGRRIALVAAGVAMVLGMVGVLPSMFPGGAETAPPAAAIPMLAYSHPAGVDGPSELHELADQLRVSSGVVESGRYFFEHRQRVGYSMHEVEVSEGYWEVDRLVFTEDEEYLWHDTTDLSGGRLHIQEIEGETPDEHEIALAAGEDLGGLVDVPDSPQAVYDAVMANNDQHQRYPGHYLIDAYNFQANKLSQEDRAIFLEAIALAGDVTSYGQVTDREGRDGIAFGASRLENDEGETVEIEWIMVLDPTTGEVLELDTIYPNDLPGAPGVVEDYTLVIDSRYTDTLPPCGTDVCPGASTTNS